MQETNKIPQKKVTVLLIAPLVFIPILCLMFGLLFAQAENPNDAKNTSKTLVTSLPSATTSDSGFNKIEAGINTEKKNESSSNVISSTLQSSKPNTNKSATENLIASIDAPKEGAANASQIPAAPNQDLSLLNQRYNNLYKDAQSGGVGGDGQRRIPSINNFNTKNGNTKQNYNNAPINEPKRAVQQQNNYNSESGKITRSSNSSSSKNENNNNNENNLRNLPPSANTQMVSAVVNGDQKVLSNDGRITLRILQPLVYKDVTVPANSYIWGFAAGASGTNRLAVIIKSFIFNGKSYNINGEVYDLDGNRGINVPSSGLQTIKNLNQGSEEIAQETDNAINQSLGGQPNLRAAASAGRVVTGIFKRKNQNRVQNIMIHLDNEYHIFILIKSDQ